MSHLSRLLDVQIQSPGYAPTNGQAIVWDSALKKYKPGTAGGAQGPAGGAITIPYTFDTNTAGSDPGAGKLKLNNSTQNAATVLMASDTDSGSSNWGAVLLTIDDSTSAIKGHLRLSKADDGTKWIVFSITGLTPQAGWEQVVVAVVGASAASPFANGDAVLLEFSRTGDAGPTAEIVSSDTSPTLDSSIAAGYGAFVDEELVIADGLEVVLEDGASITIV